MAAAELGADAIGLNFYPSSPRYVELGQLPAITECLPEQVEIVALFVDADVAAVRAVIDATRIDLLQFHGSETAQFCEQFDKPYMKVIAVRADSDLEREVANYPSAKYILLDSFDPVRRGGTGKTFDWDKVKLFSQDQKERIVLAGGLQPDNVVEAIEIVHPLGVDVSSGVEASKGIKDFEKMKLFIKGVRTSG